MKTNDTRLATGHQARNPNPNQRSRSLWLEPAAFAFFLVVSFMVPVPLDKTQSYWSFQLSVGDFLAPALDQALPALAIVATLAVALAVMTKFGAESQAMSSDLHSLLRGILWLADLFLVALAVCATRAAIANAQRWPDAIIVLALIWMIALCARLALGDEKPDTKAMRAERDWQGRKRRARRYGLKKSDGHLPTASPWAALVAAAPPLTWLALMAATATLTSAGEDPWRLVSLLLYSVGPTTALAALSCIWLTRRDLSAPRKQAWPPTTGLLCFGLAFLAASVIPILLAPGAPLLWFCLGATSIVAFAAQLAVVLSPSIRRRVPWVRNAEDAATVRSLRAAYAIMIETRARARAMTE